MYNISSGEIQDGVLYRVLGDQSVVYNGTTFNTGEAFRGVTGITDFSFEGTGMQLVAEILEIKGGAIELEPTKEFPKFEDEKIEIKGIALEFELNEAEKIAADSPTIIMGASIELTDYPYYAFQITETRL